MHLHRCAGRSWRELDSVCGVKETSEGSDVQGLDEVMTPQQLNGGTLEEDGEVKVRFKSIYFHITMDKVEYLTLVYNMYIIAYIHLYIR